MPLADRADWSGIEIKVCPVGTDKNRKLFAHLVYDGRQYATEYEVMAAKLLTKLGAVFTPNVSFEFPAPPRFTRRRTSRFVPDFVFNKKAYIWTDPDGTEQLIHGIEVKGASKRRGKKRFAKWAVEKIDGLRKHRGIVIKLVSNDDIEVFSKQGRLPMRPFDG